jgi:hypothetical protein
VSLELSGGIGIHCPFVGLRRKAGAATSRNSLRVRIPPHRNKSCVPGIINKPSLTKRSDSWKRKD